MSNLKFRAWLKKDKVMFKLNGFQKLKENEIELYATNCTFTCNLDNVVLMQATGLKDENGIEIYEGDILKEKDTGRIFGEVYYMEGIYRCNAFILNLVNDKCYVAGNIYENEELLENETIL